MRFGRYPHHLIDLDLDGIDAARLARVASEQAVS